MKEKNQQNLDFSRLHKVFGLFAFERKKSITAACLLIVMLLMWVRLLIGKSPKNAPAAGQELPFIADQMIAQTGIAQPDIAVKFIDLPKIEGRNDRLTRDFFAINNVASKRFTGTGIVNDKIVKRLKYLLKLDAIVSSNNPQAFINNKLYKTGDKIDISDGNKKYDCVIENIGQTEVLIDCLGTKIKLEIANQLEVIE